MSYVALYRKYRPKSFLEVVGQEIIVDILKNSIINHKISHAYIFSGPRGTGKTSIAKIFAKAINCLNSKDGNPCLECDICKNDNLNIDIIEIDAASNNGVDEIREIRNNARLLPSLLKYKVYIIDEAHMLTQSAANALLKTLEEPPNHVIFILATTEINKLPSTVLSRCQRLDFKKISPKYIENHLNKILKNENKFLKPEIIKKVATISDGSFRDAINLVDQILAINKDKIELEDLYNLTGEIDVSIIIDLLEYIIEFNLKDGLRLVEDLYQTGKNFVHIALKLQEITRDIIILNKTDNYFDKEYEYIIKKFLKTDINKMIELSSLLIELLSNLKKSINQKIVFETYFIRMSLLFEKEIIKDISIKEEIKQKIYNDSPKSISEFKLDDNFKNIRINNALCEADKELKIEFVKEFKNIENFITDKQYSSIVNLLSKATPEVISKRNVIFVLDNEFEIVLFNKNIDLIEKFIKKLYLTKYSVVAVDKIEWKNIRNKYIKDIKSGKIYTYIEEKKEVKKTKKKTALENEAENIFGDILTEE